MLFLNNLGHWFINLQRFSKSQLSCAKVVNLEVDFPQRGTVLNYSLNDKNDNRNQSMIICLHDYHTVK